MEGCTKTSTTPGPGQSAEDTATQATLVAGLKTEDVFAGDDGIHTSSGESLSTREPSLDWSGGAVGSIHIVAATVVTVDDTAGRTGDDW